MESIQNQNQDPDVVTSAKLFIFNGPDLLLLCRAGAGTENIRPGQIDLPGGMLEAGETPEQGGIRETREETGIELDSDSVMPVYESWAAKPDGVIVNRKFLVAYTGSRAVELSVEHQDSMWVPVNEAEEIITHPPHLEALRHIVGQQIHVSAAL